MNIEKLAEYYFSISHIPVQLWEGNRLVAEFCVRSFQPNPAYHFVKQLLFDREPAGMDVTITRESLICGYVRERHSGKVLVLGPVLEFPCVRKTAYSLLSELSQSRQRAEELMHFFEKIPTMPLTTFTRNLVFLNFVINEESPPEAFWGEKLTTLLGKEQDIQDQDRTIIHSPRSWDRQLEACVEFGKIDELNTLMQKMTREGQMGIAAGDSLRSIKNVAISTIALLARAAYRGGMDYEAALTLSDEYAQKVEILQSHNEVFSLIYDVFYQYTSRVARIRSLKADSPLIRAVASYVQEHIREPIRVSSISEHLGYSESHLCRTFKKETGKTLSEYIHDEKMEEAKLLLSSTDKSIIDLALCLGYSSHAYFATLFKKRTGMTPGEFRKVVKG